MLDAFADVLDEVGERSWGAGSPGFGVPANGERSALGALAGEPDVESCPSTGDRLVAMGWRVNESKRLLVLLAAEFELEMEWQAAGVSSAAHWIARELGVAVTTAREWVRVGHALGALPLLDAAFAGNELSYAKVRAVSAHATQDNEAELIELARERPAGRLNHALARFLAKDETGEERDHRHHEDRSFTFRTDPDGMIVGTFQLPPAIGQRIVSAIETQIRRQDCAQHPGAHDSDADAGNDGGGHDEGAEGSEDGAHQDTSRGDSGRRGSGRHNDPGQNRSHQHGSLAGEAGHGVSADSAACRTGVDGTDSDASLASADRAARRDSEQSDPVARGEGREKCDGLPASCDDPRQLGDRPDDAAASSTRRTVAEMAALDTSTGPTPGGGGEESLGVRAGPFGWSDGPSWARQQWADAFVEVFEHGTSFVTEVVLHVRGDGNSCDDGTPLTDNAILSQLPVSLLRAMIHDAERRPINASGRQRHPTDRQKRVVRERDGECVDCGNTLLLQYDHVPDFERTKHTIVDELQLRCPPCHRARHNQPDATTNGI